MGAAPTDACRGAGQGELQAPARKEARHGEGGQPGPKIKSGDAAELRPGPAVGQDVGGAPD